MSGIGLRHTQGKSDASHVPRHSKENRGLDGHVHSGQELRRQRAKQQRSKGSMPNHSRYLEKLEGPTGLGDPAVPPEVVSAREWVVTACADGSAAMWDANTGEWCKSLFGHDLHPGWRVRGSVFFALFLVLISSCGAFDVQDC